MLAHVPQARKVELTADPTPDWCRAAALLEGPAPARGAASGASVARGAAPGSRRPVPGALVPQARSGTAAVSAAPAVVGRGGGGSTVAQRGPVRRPWSDKCMRCGAHVPQRQPAAVCDMPGCVELACLRCEPDLSKVVTCPTHAASVTQVHTADGPRTIVAAVDPRELPAHTPAAAVPWYSAVVVFLAAAPEGACTSMERAMRYFAEWVRFIGLAWEQLCPLTVCSYLIARCCPVVGADVPAIFGRRVAPSTAASDVTALRRRARLAGDSSFLAILCDEAVVRLCALLTANTKKKKSTKAPILLRHLRELWVRIGKGTSCTLGRLRNAALLVVGLLAGMRRREIVALRLGDASWDAARRELTIAVRRDKTNTNIVAAQSPRSVVVAHALLDEVWPVFATRFRLSEQNRDGPLFPEMTGCTVRRTESLMPATINTVVRESLPGLPVSPHSLRVGFATELAAAGVDIGVIMELGRWSSLAALHYVLPSADKMAEATRAIGGGIRVDRAVLQRSLGADPAPPRARKGPAP